MTNLFDLTGKVAVVTGGAGLLGRRHIEALLTAGADVACLDLKELEADFWAEMQHAFQRNLLISGEFDVSRVNDVRLAASWVNEELRRPVDILINNACNNPRVGSFGDGLTLEHWNDDLAVGLTGPMLCSMEFGRGMAQRGSGVILNIASEYALIAPDQRLYRKPGLLEHQQPIKPSSYSVVKHGLIGLTKWLATYWAGKGVRVNCLSPGGVSDNQPEEFVERYVNTIPLGRMACPTDMQGAVLFLCSDASSFMTGANVVVDGGRSCW